MLAFTLPPGIPLSCSDLKLADPLCKRYDRDSYILDLYVNNEFQIYFTPSLGFFSPFSHDTCSLSLIKAYLGLEGGPPIFKNLQRLSTAHFVF